LWRSSAETRNRCAESLAFEIFTGVPLPARKGDERLSERQKGDPISASDKQKKPAGSRTDATPVKPRANDVGRALRSVYDETLRESVPDDFKDLLGKLS